jgi:outer membrane protein OmpA-like peptidoglycan-associated protein
LTVRSAAGESRLDTAYAAAEVSASGKIFGRKKNAESVALRYAAELDAQARRPVSFTVYYVTASATDLTPESIPVIEALKTELAKRLAPEITVIGHTDSVGSDEANDLLSLQRAQTVRQVLIESGVQAISIDATGRGEREPLVTTADDVDEPRNRRVEISVR